VADHIAQIREIQIKSKSEYDVGFTEFVPLSFVAKESPMWKLQNEKEPKTAQNDETKFDLTGSESKSSGDPSGPWIRSGPTGVEVVLTHAVSRMMLAGHIENIQVTRIKARDGLHCRIVLHFRDYRMECSTLCHMHILSLSFPSPSSSIHQVSWPKEGYRMSQVLLGCGVNDLGGTLMNESISTAAGMLSSLLMLS
jgi:2-iminoacetate synthase ThiH